MKTNYDLVYFSHHFFLLCGLLEQKLKGFSPSILFPVFPFIFVCC